MQEYLRRRNNIGSVESKKATRTTRGNLSAKKRQPDEVLEREAKRIKTEAEKKGFPSLAGFGFPAGLPTLGVEASQNSQRNATPTRRSTRSSKPTKKQEGKRGVRSVAKKFKPSHADSKPEIDMEAEEEHKEDRGPTSSAKIKKKKAVSRSSSQKESGDKVKRSKTDEVRESVQAREEDNLEEFLPDFLKEENIRDAEGRDSNDPDYDPNTIQISQEWLKKQSLPTRQYWEFKKNHFNSIVLFRVWTWYQIFHRDAMSAKKILDSNWAPNKYLQVGFPASAFDKATKALVDHGFSVVVVDQVESMKEWYERYESESKESQPVPRDIIQIFTAGTMINDEDEKTRWLLTLIEDDNNNFGITLLDTSRSLVFLGHITDNSHYNQLRTLVVKFKPAEIVYTQGTISKEALTVLKHTVPNVVLTRRPQKQLLSPDQLIETLKNKYLGTDITQWPETIQQCIQTDRSALSSQAMGLSVSYLEYILIAEQVVPRSLYGSLEGYLDATSQLVLDSQCIEHLEIFEAQSVSGEMKVEGSVFGYLNHTVTGFGYRMLRIWLQGPLRSVDKINERLDAVEDMVHCQHDRDEFHLRLGYLPDLEKMVSVVYSNSIKQASNPFFSGHIARGPIKTFHKLLKELKGLNKVFSKFDNCKSEFKSSYLRRLTTYSFWKTEDGQKGEIPDFISEVEKLERKYIWDSETESLVPVKGVSKEYDQVDDEVETIREALDDEIEKVRQRFKEHSKINYVHKKCRYEMEIPANLVKGNKKPPEFELTSTRAGFLRFRTKKQKDLVRDLYLAEERLQEALVPFVCSLFTDFYEHHQIWSSLISILAQLDCLCSLAQVSKRDQMSRPSLEDSGKFFFKASSLQHPQVAKTVKNFVPNDVHIGRATDSDICPAVSLITGPNMGGKSTLLRQTCVAIIMAQIGCFVPAKSCHMATADRIFTRIGATDRLAEGKSTFYVEMEETKSILANATPSSFAIIDELGRGTSTFDGLSIAYSVLDYITQTVKCCSMFTTHYHWLLREFRESADIQMCHMAAELDESGNHVIFKYKLKEGEYPKSHGIQVARLAGISEDILTEAKSASENFEKYMMENAGRRMKKKSEKITAALKNTVFSATTQKLLLSLFQYPK